jgi:hypothetical protein
MEAADISKIIYLGPNETKKVGIVLDAQPRAMMVNTLFAKNIPGEITLPIDQIIKSKGAMREFTGEEMLTSYITAPDSNEIIIDNEDPGFKISIQNTVNRLKKLLGIQNKNGSTYQQISLMRAPTYWQPVVQSLYFGKFIHSAIYTRNGIGDKSVTWTTVIDKPGYYDVFSYIGKTTDRMMIIGGGAPRSGGGGSGGGGGGRTGGAGGPGGAQGPGGGATGSGGPGGAGRGGGARGQPSEPYKEFHFHIFYDGGVEDISLDYSNAESGWNKLGTYYLKADTAKVVLSNLSTGRAVIGDAIKWVRQR